MPRLSRPVTSSEPGIPVLAGSRPTFRAVAVTVVPDAESLDDAGWREVETVVERALAARPEKMRRQLATFLRVIRWLPVFRYGRTFESLDAGRRTRVLAGFERSRLELLRRGFWGLRTLIFMGCYGRAAGAVAIGYRASKDGWTPRLAANRSSGIAAPGNDLPGGRNVADTAGGSGS